MAIAEPMTSCMSEPMMASSTMSHRMIRGTWGGRNVSIHNEREQLASPCHFHEECVIMGPAHSGPVAFSLLCCFHTE